MKNRKLLLHDKYLDEWQKEHDRAVDFLLAGNLEAHDKVVARAEVLKIKAMAVINSYFQDQGLDIPDNFEQLLREEGLA